MKQVISPEFIQAIIGVLVILLSSLVPQFAEQIVVIAGAVATILIALFVKEATVERAEIQAGAQITAAKIQADSK